MRTILFFVTAVVSLSLPASGYAGASSFSLVNGIGVDIANVAIRRAGSSQWKSLDVAPPVGRAAAVGFADPDCSFDFRATLAGGTVVTWSSVNLCDVKLVTLRRNAAGFAWVDYD